MINSERFTAVPTMKLSSEKRNILTSIIMKPFKKPSFTRLSIALVFTILGTFSLSVSSPVAPLKIGDEYGGGKIALILSPGDPGYGEIAKQFLIASNDDISETDKWPEAQKVSDNRNVSDHYDIYLQNKARPHQVAAGGY
jgi:hypothetical protein